MSRPRVAAFLAPLLIVLAALLAPAGAGASLARPGPGAPERVAAVAGDALETSLSAHDSDFELFGEAPPDLLALSTEPAPEAFEPLAGVSLLGPAREASPRAEPSFAETRIRIFSVLGSPLIEVSNGLNRELHWGSEKFSLGVTADLGKDPEGDVDSPNLYAYVGWGPERGTDPLGLANWKPKAVRGESFSVARLQKEGWHVFYGGESHRWNAPGADIFAFNPNSGELAFFDDKNMNRLTVRKATALLENFESGPSRAAAVRAIQQAEEISEETKIELLGRLENGEFKKLIISSAPESRVAKIGSRLKEAGIEFFAPSTKTGKVLLGLAVIGILAADDKSEALGETLDPFGTMGYGNIPNDREELVEFPMLSELGKLLEQRSMAEAKQRAEAEAKHHKIPPPSPPAGQAAAPPSR